MNLLRLFPSYRRLEEEARFASDRIAEAEAERIRLTGLLTAKQNELDWARGLVDRSLATEREASRALTNFAMQRAYGVAPFPNAPKLPEQEREPESPAAEFVQASTLQQNGWREFMKKAHEYALQNDEAVS